jgi:PASTA domain
MLQEPVPRPVQRKFPLVPVVLGVLLIGLLAGAVIERDPLMQLVVGKSAATQAAPNTGTSKPTASNNLPTPSPTPTPTPTPLALVTIPNVTCMTPLVAQQAIEGAGFKFVGSFVANPSYPKDTVFKTQPGPDQAPQGSEVTAFISTGPPSGILFRNQCLSIIRVLPPDIFKLITPPPSP